MMPENTSVPEGNKGEDIQHGYRPDIDGLRAIAVIAVIINHFNRSLLPSGHLGVDIFFVISGYVITASLSRRPARSLNDFLLNFYTRRVKRLQPALVLFVLISGFLICLFNPTPSETIRTGIASLFGVSNIYLFKQATNYFARSAELDIFTHTWSLGVEEQFYLAFPLLAWASGFARNGRNGYRNLGFITGILSIISLLAFIMLSRTNQPAAYFLMPTRFWELGAGCLIFITLKKFSHFSLCIQKVPSLIPLTAILAIMHIETKSKEVVALVALTALLISCLKPGTFTYTILTRRKALYIGRISYSLYLWHWGILCLSRWTVGIYWWTVPLQLGLMLALSMISYHFVESPLRAAQWSPSRWRVIGLGLSASASTSALLSAIGVFPLFSLYTGTMSPVFTEGVNSLTNPYKLAGQNSTWQGGKCILRDTEAGKLIQLSDCTIGDFNKATRRVLVLGNSFSATFSHAFDELVLTNDYAASVTSSFGASPAPGVTIINLGYTKSNEHYWKILVPGMISHLRKGDWVFLVNDLAEYSPEKRTEIDEMRTKQIKDGLLKLSGTLRPRGIRLAVLHGLPFARDAQCEPAVAARQWYNSIGKGPCRFLGKEETLERREELNSILKDLEKEGAITIVDLIDLFCPGELCSYNAANGELLYRDGASHPSIAAVRLAAPRIRAILTAPRP
jgi:peptidoglycan/LPS O-acetylase OafA/YrhL